MSYIVSYIVWGLLAVLGAFICFSGGYFVRTYYRIMLALVCLIFLLVVLVFSLDSITLGAISIVGLLGLLYSAPKYGLMVIAVLILLFAIFAFARKYCLPCAVFTIISFALISQMHITDNIYVLLAISLILGIILTIIWFKLRKRIGAWIVLIFTLVVCAVVGATLCVWSIDNIVIGQSLKTGFETIKNGLVFTQIEELLPYFAAVSAVGMSYQIYTVINRIRENKLQINQIITDELFIQKIDNK